VRLRNQLNVLKGVAKDAELLRALELLVAKMEQPGPMYKALFKISNEGEYKAALAMIDNYPGLLKAEREALKRMADLKMAHPQMGPRAFLDYLTETPEELVKASVVRTEDDFLNFRRELDELEQKGKITKEAKDSALAEAESNRMKYEVSQPNGKINGQTVKTKTKFSDGHTANVLENGECVICSRCARIRERFDDELTNNPAINKRLRDIEDELENSYKNDFRKLTQQEQKRIDDLIEEQKILHDELLDQKATRLESQQGSNTFTKDEIKEKILNGEDFNPSSGKFETVKNSGVVSYGKNKLTKFKDHSQHMRETGRKMGIDIPKSPADPNTIRAMENYIQRVVDIGEQRTGIYMTLGNCKWSKLGDAIVVRKLDGEFVTFLDYSKKGVTFQWNLAT
jgi:hypothetical protein